jgi:hypothetical protein
VVLAFVSLDISLALVSTLGDEGDPALRLRLIQGVLQTSERIEHVSFRARCTFRSQYREVSEKTKALFAKNNRNPFEPTIQVFDCAIRGPMTLQRSTTNDGVEVIKCRNRSYAFAIKRPSSGGQPTLDFLEPIGISPAIDARIATIENQVRGMALGGLHLWGEPLAKLLQSSDFLLKRVYHVPGEPGSRLVRVDFEYTAYDSSNSASNISYTDGYLLCDPSHDWTLVEYGATCHVDRNNSTVRQMLILEYGETIDGIPIAVKTANTVTLLGDNAGSTMEDLYLVEITQRDQVPEEEFYLSHYGLPEPNFSGTWAGPWVWYLVGGIACLVIGAIILKRRKARA